MILRQIQFLRGVECVAAVIPLRWRSHVGCDRVGGKWESIGGCLQQTIEIDQPLYFIQLDPTTHDHNGPGFSGS